MKLSCLQENLNRGLSIVGRAVATRTTLPITNNVLLVADKTSPNKPYLKLVATNLEMAIVCWIDATVEEEGSITVPAKLITEFVASLPKERVDTKGEKYPEKVDMTMLPKTKTLDLKCARYQARISGVDAKDFPPIPTVEDSLKTSVDVAALRQGITQVVFAAATEESRPVLTGIDAQFEGDHLTLAAADGFRLAVYKMPINHPVSQKTEVIIPSRTMAELNRLSAEIQEADPVPTEGVKGPDGHIRKPTTTNQTAPATIEITLNPKKSQIMFKAKNWELVSQLVQGTFPNYSQLIPQNSTNKAVVDVGEFSRATKTASIFARDGSGIVRLIMNPGANSAPGKITISARSEEIGDNVGEMDAVVEGDESKIAFNGKYLSDALSVIKEAQVVLETSSPSSPGVIRPLGVDNYTYVVMPMFVQW
jgi:DNA polymerase-3 subunit beta